MIKGILKKNSERKKIGSKCMLLEKDICKLFYKQFQELKALNYLNRNICIFHVPNEQYTSIGYTRNLKAMGLTAGVADYCVLLPQGRVAFIEFKRHKNFKLSEPQIVFRDNCKVLNIPYLVTCNIEEAIEWVRKLVQENPK